MQVRKWIVNNLVFMYAPALLLFSIFVFYPLLYGVKISFTNWNGYSQHYQFIGFSNYVKLLTDVKIKTAFTNTIVYGFGSTIIQNVVGLLYALLLNRVFTGRNIVRTAIYLPVMISGLIMGFLWYFLMQYDGGALNDILAILGFEPVDWLANGKRSVGIILGITSLQYVGQAMIIYLAGLQTIPRMYYEAASIDGASRLETFVKVTLPLLMPAIITNFTLKLIGGLQIFDIIMALTGGGPGFSTHSFSTLISQLYLSNQNAGYSSALGVVLFLMILIFTLITNNILHRREVEF